MITRKAVKLIAREKSKNLNINKGKKTRYGKSNAFNKIDETVLLEKINKQKA